MYHQIARNKRNSVIVIGGFLLVWLAIGAIIGALASGSNGAIAGAIVLGILGVGAALYAYYFGSDGPFGDGGAAGRSRPVPAAVQRGPDACHRRRPADAEGVHHQRPKPQRIRDGPRSEPRRGH